MAHVRARTPRAHRPRLQGHLEEHALLEAPGGGGGGGGGGVLARLSATKRLFQEPVAALAPLPAAQQLAALSAGGAVALCRVDTLAAAPLAGVRGAVALAAAPPRPLGRPGPPGALLAVATAGAKGARLLLFHVPPAPEGGAAPPHPPRLVASVALPEPLVSGLAWAGSSLVVASPGAYTLVSPSGGTGGELRASPIASGLAVAPLAASLPQQPAAVLLFDDALAVIVGPQGASEREPLLAPAPVLALAAAGGFVLAACADGGVHVFDAATSRLLQRLELPAGAAAGRGGLLAASAPAGAGPGRALLAAGGALLVLQAVAPELQVREALKRKRYAAAFELIAAAEAAAADAPGASGGGGGADAPPAAASTAAAPPPPRWTGDALAAAGQLLLLDARFEEALGVLARAGSAAFPPAALLALFPPLAARHRAALPRPPPSAWGLHGESLPPLERLIADAVELRAATAAPVAAAAAASAASPSAATADAGAAGLDAPRSAAAEPAAAPADEAAALGRAARAALLPFLLAARRDGGDGLACAAGVDALLVTLLCDTRDAGGLEVLAAGGDSRAPVADAAAAMEAAGRWHALALLYSRLGQSSTALGIWRRLADGELAEAPAASGAVAAATAATAGAGPRHTAPAQRRVALAHAAAELGDASQTALPVVLAQLPWLLARAPAAAAAVATRRRLPPDDLLPLLSAASGAGGQDARWQFLFHRLQCGGADAAAGAPAASTSGRGAPDAADGDAHTELALLLADAACEALRSSGAGDERAAELHAAAAAAVAAAEAALAASARRAAPRPTASGPALLGRGGGGPPGTAPRPQPPPALLLLRAFQQLELEAAGLSPPWAPSDAAAAAASASASAAAATGPPATTAPPSAEAGASAASAALLRAWADAGLSPPEARAALLRGALSLHLERSEACDAAVALRALQATPLRQETVALHRRLGDHGAALRLLALRLRDVGAAVEYCRRHAGPGGWVTLLEALVRPPPGAAPDYAAACRVVEESMRADAGGGGGGASASASASSAGASTSGGGAGLDPQRLLALLPEDTPLGLAADALGRMLCGAGHRRRAAAVTKALRRAQNLEARSERAAARAQCTIVDESSACGGCGRRLGGRVFVRFPAGGLMCVGCARSADTAGLAADAPC